MPSMMSFFSDPPASAIGIRVNSMDGPGSRGRARHAGKTAPSAAPRIRRRPRDGGSSDIAPLTRATLELDNAAPHSDGDRLCAVIRAQLLHDVLQVYLDGLFRDVEQFANIAITIATGYVPQDLGFALRERVIAHVLGQLFGDLRWNALLAQAHLANYIQQLRRGHVLQQVTTSAGAQSALNLDVAFEGGQHDDASVREFGANRDQHVDAAEVG